MKTIQARRTLKLTAICLAGATTWACGGPAATDCSQTATCGSTEANDAGQAGGNATTSDGATIHGDATTQSDAAIHEDATVDAGTQTVDGATADAVTSDVGATEAAAPQGCKIDNDCQTNESCCAGQCFNSKTDAKHCGGCSACAVTNATAACTNGACTVATCSQGFVDCDGNANNGCELATPAGPSAPAPTRPVVGEYTGSFRADAGAKTQRPTFKWTASSADTCGAVSYQVQLDDSCQAGSIQQCAFASPEVDTTVTTTSFTPATALTVHQTQPVGTRYYWRVRACDAAKVCSSWSSVRYVDVGRLRDDLNGDGYSDLLVRGGASNLYLYLGGKPPSEQAASHGASGTFFALAGDINGDGYADFIAGDPSANGGVGSNGAVRVYYGRAAWNAEMGNESFLVNASVDGTSGFATDVGAAGDFNGDGYADFMATHPSDAKVSLFYGANVTDAVTTLPGLSFAGQSQVLSDGFGRAGDLDGDGFSEVGVLSRRADGSTVLDFFRGGPTPTNTVLRSQDIAAKAFRMRPAGDLDGDGFDDVVLSAVSGYSALVSVRGQAGFAANGGIVATRTFEDDNTWHDGIAAGLDANGDGLPDVYWTPSPGFALALIPGVSGFDAQSPSTSVTQPAGAGDSAGSALTTGDYDGDGIADLALASTRWTPDYPSITGLVTVVLHTGTVRHLTATSMVGFGAALGH